MGLGVAPCSLEFEHTEIKKAQFSLVTYIVVVSKHIEYDTSVGALT